MAPAAAGPSDLGQDGTAEGVEGRIRAEILGALRGLQGVVSAAWLPSRDSFRVVLSGGGGDGGLARCEACVRGLKRQRRRLEEDLRESNLEGPYRAALEEMA